MRFIRLFWLALLLLATSAAAQPAVRFIRLFWLALLLLATSAAAQPTSYTAPEEFMDLFFDFTGRSILDTLLEA